MERFSCTDFSQGSTVKHRRRLGDVVRVLPATVFRGPPGLAGPLNVPELPLTSYGLRLRDYTDVEVRLPMTCDAYLPLRGSTKVNVDSALTRGAYNEQEAHDWCPAHTADGSFERWRAEHRLPGISRDADRPAGP